MEISYYSETQWVSNEYNSVTFLVNIHSRKIIYFNLGNTIKAEFSESEYYKENLLMKNTQNRGEKMTCSPLAWVNIWLRGFQHNENIFTIQGGDSTKWCEVLKRSSAYSTLSYSTRFTYINDFSLSLLIFQLACILEISALNSPPLMVIAEF